MVDIVREMHSVHTKTGVNCYTIIADITSGRVRADSAIGEKRGIDNIEVARNDCIDQLTALELA